MKAKCATCGREYELIEGTAITACASCGGELKLQDNTIELAEDSLNSGITCPNCGKWIEPGSQICTACGYSRRLGRTLTTRVGMPEFPKHARKTTTDKEPDTPEIEAEKIYRRAKSREAAARADWFRLLVSLICLLLLAAIVMGAPMNWLGIAPLKMPALLSPPKFDALNASFLMAIFLFVAVPITAIAVRIVAAITGIETSNYFAWLRTAGALAAAIVTLEFLFTADQLALHLETRWLMIVLPVTTTLALFVFTWFLQNVNFSAAIVLWIATLIGAAVGLFAAAAAFGWLGHLLGIDPVIKPINTWSWPKLGG